jgi:hypothetical protein
MEEMVGMVRMAKMDPREKRGILVHLEKGIHR